ncbi:MAG: peptidylprolyl isomerase [Pseudomonadota bacterium]
MSEEKQVETKKKSPLIGILAVVIIAAGGAMAYMSQTKDSQPPETMEEMAAETVSESANTEENAVSQASNIEPAAEQEQAAAPEAQSIVVEPGNPVVAKVDGKDITRVDVYRYIQSMPQNLQQLPAQTVYPLALEQTINTRLVQNKANAANLAEDPEVQSQLDMARQQIIRNVYLQRKVNETITEDDIKTSYDAFIREQQPVEERQASHILLETEEAATAAIKRLDEGAEFAALAQELSTGPTGPKGGDLGYFTKADMVPEFAEAAFSMKTGDVSKKPVQTQFGFHVIKVMDVRQRPMPTLEEMKPSIEAELRRAALEKMVADWRDEAEVETFDINGKPLAEGQSPFGGEAGNATAPAAGQ